MDEDNFIERPCDGPQSDDSRRGPAGYGTSSDEEQGDKENGENELVADAVQPLSSSKAKKMKSWPHTQSLFPAYSTDIRALLKAVDDTGCVKQPKAANVNPKGNAWAQCYVVCYGGSPGSGRGALAFSELPILENAVKLKRKVVQIWAFVNKADNEKKTIMDDIVHSCKCQQEQYDKHCDDVNNTTEQQRRLEELQAKMLDYETGKGAIPPGAKGKKGGGRVEHSTNTRLGQPATFQWANQQTDEANHVTDLGNEIEIESDVLSTPVQKPKQGRGRSSSTKINSTAQDRLESFSDGMSQLTAQWTEKRSSPKLSTPERKRHRLNTRRDELRDDIRFARELKGDGTDEEEEYNNLKSDYKKVLDAIKKLDAEDKELNDLF